MGILYIVSTPIGNLKDITLRAIETLRNVDYIACEDTRRTGNLLNELYSSSPFDKLRARRTRFPYSSSEALLSREATSEDSSRQARTIKPRLLSYYEQNELRRIPEIISLLMAGNDVALVCDAGTPTISDPGFKLVRQCIELGIKVESIPGPSSVLTALTVSGLPTDKFLFLGYPPKKEGHRKGLFATLLQSSNRVTIIMFEAPHRLLKTLAGLQEVFGDIDVVICRELTKVHEEIRREKISQSIKHFQQVNPKGEFVILFHSGTIEK